jgi:hypothetical protein
MALGLGDKIGQVRSNYFADLAIFRKLHADPYRSVVEATERDVKLVMIGGNPCFGDLGLMRELKGADAEPMDILGVEKGIDITDSAFPSGEQTLADIQNQLQRGLLVEPEFLRSRFGAGLDPVEFDRSLNRSFPGLRPAALDLLFPDESFFEAIRSSTNAAPGFDIAVYWRAAIASPDTRVLELVNHPGTTAELLDRQVGLNRRTAQSIIKYRAGLDGQLATADDLAFGSIGEIDAVRFVGPDTINRLRRFVTELNR